MTRWAKITTRFEAFHRYPGAPEEVAFLRRTHRHIFHVSVWIEQFHDNRDVEFILFKRHVEKLIKDTTWEPSSSCEHIANVLKAGISPTYPRRRLKIEILEDGENGALVEF